MSRSLSPSFCASAEAPVSIITEPARTRQQNVVLRGRINLTAGETASKKDIPSGRASEWRLLRMSYLRVTRRRRILDGRGPDRQDSDTGRQPPR